MIDLTLVLEELSRKRPIFHSEADFQHALAWELHEAIPEAQVRLEYRPPGMEKTSIDIWLGMATGPLAIELKYVTRRFDAAVAGERYELNNHGAQDVRRYDFLKDFVRLERVVATVPSASAAAIFLTNDDSYWRESLRSEQIDAAFRIHDGRQLQGPLAWGAAAGPGTTKGRTESLRLHGAYQLAWRDYATLHGAKGRFRYALVEVTGGCSPHTSSRLTNT